VAGLEVVHVDKASGKDTAVTFTLTGPAEDIDRALTAAGFDAPPSAGASAFQSDMGVLPGDLADIVSASDVWVDPHDVPFTRQYLRGTLEDGSGDEALAVFAFTMWALGGALFGPATFANLAPLTVGTEDRRMIAVSRIETDYLVVGAGAAGLAFTDALVTDSDADVVMVDRRSEPGGHWNDAYPFVRLHQPSAYYGVNSLVLGSDSIDESGPNAGLYERATAPEIRAYYRRVLGHLLASDQVKFFGRSEYAFDGSEGHTFTDLDTGAETTVEVRRRLVDATYLESYIPATHTPAFVVDEGVRFAPVNALADVPE